MENKWIKYDEWIALNNWIDKKDSEYSKILEETKPNSYFTKLNKVLNKIKEQYGK